MPKYKEVNLSSNSSILLNNSLEKEVLMKTCQSYVKLTSVLWMVQSNLKITLVWREVQSNLKITLVWREVQSNLKLTLVWREVVLIKGTLSNQT